MIIHKKTNHGCSYTTYLTKLEKEKTMVIKFLHLFGTSHFLAPSYYGWFSIWAEIIGGE